MPRRRHRPLRYILNDADEPVPCDDMVKWSLFCGTDPRRIVGRSTFGDGLILVSTIFTGMDYNWSLVGPPIVYETMMFGTGETRLCSRTHTRDEALHAHQAACAVAREWVKNAQRLTAEL
jgi:hypothetical protein